MRLPGHPDAVCDLVVESIIDEYLRRDPESRLRISAQGGHGALFITGDVLSKADFDVSALAKRTMAKAGVLSDIEPFVSLEAVASEQNSHVLSGGAMPVKVMGYATAETPENIPEPLILARRLAQTLDAKRIDDESWFWAGADGSVCVLLTREQKPTVYVSLEQGTASLEDVRTQIAQVVHSISPQADVHINVSGSQPARGLALVSGASGRDISPYGQMLPAIHSPIGCDIRDSRKAGVWLMRRVAKEVLAASGAGAILVQAMYMPGNVIPTYLSARDERGRDMHTYVTREATSLRRVIDEWHCHTMSAQAARWGYAGCEGLPWE